MLEAKRAFWDAVGCLATTNFSVQERLAQASIKLSHLAHRFDELPEPQSSEFQRFWHDLSNGGSTSAAVAARKLSAEQAGLMAQRILDLCKTIEA